MKISVVTTMYFSQDYLDEFYARTVKAIQSLGLQYEMVLVDDGSPDHSLETAMELQRLDPRIEIIELSRNFGHHQAIMAGLKECSGDIVFLIDCDLEESPELLLDFHSKMLSARCDVVYGVQDKRKGNWNEKLFGFLFYKLFNHFAHQKIPENITMCRLMSRRYVDSLKQFDEKEFFLGATFASVGFKQEPISVAKGSKGTSAYSLAKRIALMVNAIVSSSNKPLVYVFYVGAFISVSVMLGVMGVFYYHFFVKEMQVGWPSLILSIWFLGGLIILSIGVVGIYLSKIYSETKKRPTVIVRDRHTRNRSA